MQYPLKDNVNVISSARNVSENLVTDVGTLKPSSLIQIKSTVGFPSNESQNKVTISPS